MIQIHAMVDQFCVDTSKLFGREKDADALRGEKQRTTPGPYLHVSTAQRKPRGSITLRVALDLVWERIQLSKDCEDSRVALTQQLEQTLLNFKNVIEHVVLSWKRPRISEIAQALHGF